MSRIAKSPIPIPQGVTVNLEGQSIAIEGPKGRLERKIHQEVELLLEDNVLTFTSRSKAKKSSALAGTTRALVNNMVLGVTSGFEKRLKLVGVGYRAELKGKALNLTLGFSHPVSFDIPDAISIEIPSNTEIIVKGIDKQNVGQIAANIRAYRPPEPYKGKGVRYADEVIMMKEVKKKK
jgi:large subunit ribosomal protein L6